MPLTLATPHWLATSPRAGRGCLRLAGDHPLAAAAKSGVAILALAWLCCHAGQAKAQPDAQVPAPGQSAPQGQDVRPAVIPAAVPPLSDLSDTPVSLLRRLQSSGEWVAAGQGVWRGWWLPVPAASKAPAVVLLHGCNGALDAQGRVSLRPLDFAALLQREGWHVMVLDSFTPRGLKEICTHKLAGRSVTPADRAQDVAQALGWLSSQPGVDADRLAIVGWSNGGSTVLSSVDASQQVGQSLWPKAAVAFYPGCGSRALRRFDPRAALLVMSGGLDDWTPAEPCRLAMQRATAQWPSRVLSYVEYEGAYHGFDGTGEVKLRADVPNGVNPGQGVHVGGHAPSRQASRQQLMDFLRQQLSR